jgi:hypothetical protein
MENKDGREFKEIDPAKEKVGFKIIGEPGETKDQDVATPRAEKPRTLFSYGGRPKPKDGETSEG